MKTVVIVSHPNWQQSIANKTIVENLKEKVENIQVRHLETLYPDFKIDVIAEQNALLGADFIIFQHPFYWYSTPAILKKYMDDVLLYGFAFGAGGDKLKGKQFLQSITVGGPKESYTPLGYNRFSVEDFLKPMQQTIYLTQMVYHTPIYSHRNFYQPEIWNSVSEVTQNATQHAEKIIAKIQDFERGNTQKVEAFIQRWFQHFDALDENGYFLQYLHKEVELSFPDSGKLLGHKGFNEWYNAMKEKLETPTRHQVTHLTITEPQRNYFDIDFKVQFQAQEKGTKNEIDVVASEQWKLVWDDTSNRPIIERYIVTV